MSVVTSALLITCHLRLIVILRPDLPEPFRRISGFRSTGVFPRVVLVRGGCSRGLDVKNVGASMARWPGVEIRTLELHEDQCSEIQSKLSFSDSKFKGFSGLRFRFVLLAVYRFEATLHSLERARRERCNEY